jgi:hypothetical protein
MKIFNKKIKRRDIYICLTVVVFIAALLIPILLINISARKMDKYTEITFVTPTDVIIFWKSKDSTLGYVKYGDKRFGKSETVLQTSSEEGEIHVVFLENIPKEGVYIRKVNESDSFLVLPSVEYIKYDSNTDEGF